MLLCLHTLFQDSNGKVAHRLITKDNVLEVVSKPSIAAVVCTFSLKTSNLSYYLDTSFSFSLPDKEKMVKKKPTAPPPASTSGQTPRAALPAAPEGTAQQLFDHFLGDSYRRLLEQEQVPGEEDSKETSGILPPHNLATPLLRRRGGGGGFSHSIGMA